MCSKAYDDVTDFEFCGFTKNKKNLNVLNIFSSNEKIIHHTLRAITWQKIVFYKPEE